MAKEIEVKVLNINKQEMINKLESLGAELVKHENQANHIFDTKDMLGNNKLSYLRLRETHNCKNDDVQYTFTLKSNISTGDVRVNEEIETKVEDKDALIKILSKLNIKEKHIGKKERISYIKDDILFEIDTWDEETYPHPYMELEVKDKKDLKKAIDMLNIKEEDVTSKSLYELRKDLSDNNV